MRKPGWAVLLLFMMVLLLTACSSSFEEEKTAANEAVEAELDSDQEKANNSNENIEYHLPFGIEKEKETENNILLKNGAKTYILFYNPLEDRSSDIGYQSTLKLQSEWDVNETYKTKDEFGYFLAKKLDKNLYQVITGVGGVKVTTETKNLRSDASLMMSIANSVSPK